MQESLRISWPPVGFGIDAFPYYCPGARRGNVFVATWLLRPGPRSTSIVSTVCEFNCDHLTSLCEVFCLVFDLWFFLMLRRPRCFVTTAVLFLTEQFKKKKIRKKGSFPDRASSPASRKTTPSSVAGCLVRISGSSVVCSDRVTLWLSTVECCRRRDREV